MLASSITVAVPVVVALVVSAGVGGAAVALVPVATLDAYTPTPLGCWCTDAAGCTSFTISLGLGPQCTQEMVRFSVQFPLKICQVRTFFVRKIENSDMSPPINWVFNEYVHDAEKKPKMSYNAKVKY